MTTTTRSPVHDTAADVVVRAARHDEHPAVGELTLAGFTAGPYPPDPGRAAELLDAAGRAATADLRVAQDRLTGELLGTSTLARGGTPWARFAEPDELGLRLLAVSPSARGRGIGALLLDDAVAQARRAGLPRVVLDTGARNETSQRLYHRHGFSRLPGRAVGSGSWPGRENSTCACSRRHRRAAAAGWGPRSCGTPSRWSGGVVWNAWC